SIVNTIEVRFSLSRMNPRVNWSHPRNVNLRFSYQRPPGGTA
ncbi:MAG: hypothetical protein JWO38_6581, partial [Gemmataceae bacterium]|nr:hypothetical protein [Gemmataceae bacterium]